jgi:hypothetical protein
MAKRNKLGDQVCGTSDRNATSHIGISARHLIKTPCPQWLVMAMQTLVSQQFLAELAALISDRQHGTTMSPDKLAGWLAAHRFSHLDT